MNVFVLWGLTRSTNRSHTLVSLGLFACSVVTSLLERDFSQYSLS